MGVTVTFIAILQLMKDGLIEIVQAEPYAPIHVRPATGSRQLTVVSNNDAAIADADAENEAALAQPAHPDEDEEYVEPDDLAIDGSDAVEPDSSESSSSEPSATAEDVPANDVVATDSAEHDAAEQHETTDEASTALESSTDDTVTRATEDDENTGQGQ
jgi:segregation and condensation protein A